MTTAVLTIQEMNGRRAKSSRSWSRVCAGSPMAPNIAIKTAPMQTRTVPRREYLVNGSPRIRVAKMVLKTRPDYSVSVGAHASFSTEGTPTAWRVERTGSGRVVIWMELPMIFEMTNINMPS